MARRTVGLLALTVIGVSCVAIPRYPPVERGATPYPAARLAEELDPWLLADGLSERVVVEIDWVAGARPGPRAVAGLDRVLRRYVPASVPVEVLLDDEIPEQAWRSAGAHPESKLVESWAQTATAEPGVERRYALFLPTLRHGLFGYSSDWSFLRDGEPIQVRGVVVSYDAHARYAKLWIDVDRLLRGTLIHEFGHQLGLVTNDRHERTARHWLHCTSLVCLMAHPTARVIARNAAKGLFNKFPRDYCDRCQEDIRRAQAWWRERMAEDPGYVAARDARRQADVMRSMLSRLGCEKRYEEMLRLAREGREGFPDAGGWGVAEVRALWGLERVEDARAALDRLLVEGAGTDPDWRGLREIATRLIRHGRYGDVLRLVPVDRLGQAPHREVDQVAFQLRIALSGTGRSAETVDVIVSLAHRGRGSDVFGEVTYAWALLEADRLDEAAPLIERGLRGKHDEQWSGAALELARRRGDEARARAHPCARRWGGASLRQSPRAGAALARRMAGGLGAGPSRRSDRTRTRPRPGGAARSRWRSRGHASSVGVLRQGAGVARARRARPRRALARSGPRGTDVGGRSVRPASRAAARVACACGVLRRLRERPAARPVSAGSRAAVALRRPRPCLRRLDRPIARGCRRDQGADELARGLGHALDGTLEGRGVGPRGPGRPAHLAHELDRGCTDLLVGRRRLEVEQRPDVAAHVGVLRPRKDIVPGDGGVLEVDLGPFWS